MAVTRETLHLLHGLRIQIDDTVSAVTEDLVRAWANGWQLVVRDWEDAVGQLESLRSDGRWPTVSQVVRAEKAQAALEATYKGLQQLTDEAGVRILGGVGEVVQAANSHLDIIASQLPQQQQAVARAYMNRADTDQIRQIVVRTQEQVTKTLFPLPGDSFTTIRNTLVRGVAQGTNPREVARRMVRGVYADYAASLNRAMVVARTEMLDAHRVAAAAQQQANAKLLEGWQWAAALDERTCPACWAEHGNIYPLEVGGPDDHHQGRCARVAVVRSWKDLGYDVPEPASLMPDAQVRFDALGEDKQLAIMGPARLQALQSGKATLADMSTRRSNIGWRDSIGVTRVGDLP